METEELWHSILTVSLLYRRIVDRKLNEEGDGELLSGGVLRLLRYIQYRGREDVFQKDLEKEFRLRRSTISKTVDAMEQKQLILRQDVDGDARLKKLVLTEKSKKLLQKRSEKIDSLEQLVRKSFQETDYRELSNLLGSLKKVLEHLEESEQAEPLPILNGKG